MAGLLDVLKRQQGIPEARPYKGIPFGLLGSWAKENPGQAALTAGGFAPSPVGDVLGVAGDVKHYIENPEDATWGNIAMTGASLIPGIPAVAATVSEARKAVDKASTDLSAGKPPAKPTSIVQTPDLRDLDTPTAIQTARSEPHIIQAERTGQFVGAPRGFTTRQQIQDARKKFDEEVEKGILGARWYHDARASNVKTQRGPREESLAAGEQALWSAQAPPGPNFNWAVDARNSYAAGKMPKKMRTGAQSRTYVEGREGFVPGMGHNQGPSMQPAGGIRLGKKTGIYGQHLDPNVPFATTGTNDIWHARQFGFTNADGSEFSRALTPQEHRWLDYETMLAVDRANKKQLGGRSDWTAAEIQAAPWVAGKARGLVEKSGGKKSYEQAFAEAKMTYPDHVPTQTVSMPHEQIPGKSTGILGDLIDAPTATKRQFSREADWRDARGRDVLMDDIFDGGYVAPTSRGTGSYVNTAGQLEVNPVDVANPMVGIRVSPTTGEKYIPVPQKRALAAGSATRGLLDFQEGTPYGKIMVGGKGVKNAAQMNIGRMPTQSEMSKVAKLADKHDVPVVMNSADGLIIHDFKVGKTREFTKLMKGPFGQGLEKIFPGMRITKGRYAGGYYDLSGELAKAGTGKAVMRVLDETEKLKRAAPKLYDNLMDSTGVQIKAKDNLARLDRWEKTLGKSQRSDYRKLLELVGDRKLRGLRDYVKKYGPAGLPAIAALGVFGASAGRQDEL